MGMFLIQLIKRNVQASLGSSLFKKHIVDNCVVAQKQWGKKQKKTEEVVKRLRLSSHFLRLLLDERLGDCLLPLLQRR